MNLKEIPFDTEAKITHFKLFIILTIKYIKYIL